MMKNNSLTLTQQALETAQSFSTDGASNIPPFPLHNTDKIMPEAVGGWIPTLNNMGVMSPVLDEIGQEFIEYVLSQHSASPMEILEIGGAYGNIALECLRKGIRKFSINDLDSRHLTILLERARAENSNYPLCLVPLPGDFPDTLKLMENYYGAIVSARVFHFFNPKKLERSIQELHRILRPGGRIYLSSMSPYAGNYKKSLKEYKDKYNNGIEYPGYTHDLFASCVADSGLSDDTKALHKKEQEFNFMDSKVLKRVFEKYNFKVLKSIEFPLPYNTPGITNDGRELVGIVAYKED